MSSDVLPLPSAGSADFWVLSHFFIWHSTRSSNNKQKTYCFCPHLESYAWLIFPLLAVSSVWTGWRDVWNRLQLTSNGCRIWASLTATRTQVILVTVVSEVLQPEWLLAYCGLNILFVWIHHDTSPFCWWCWSDHFMLILETTLQLSTRKGYWKFCSNPLSDVIQWLHSSYVWYLVTLGPSQTHVTIHPHIFSAVWDIGYPKILWWIILFSIQIAISSGQKTAVLEPIMIIRPICIDISKKSPCFKGKSSF